MISRPPSAFKALLYIIIFLCGFSFISFSQTDTIMVASYNLLNYPGSDATTRNPYFRKVIHTMKPDILIVGEMTSQTGVNTFLNEVMNKYQPGLYTTIPFHDGPDTDAEIFFRADKVSIVSANYIPTALRDIAEYTLRLKNSNEILKIYAVHLKASQGYESDRLAEATILRNWLNNLAAGTNFIVVGDYNIYTSTEPAFQKLIGSETDNDGRCFDPLNAVGTWYNNSTFRFIHTQSPRVRAFGGGSTGGMDDRFDIILRSESLSDNLIVSSYTAYGNDGNHFNDSINRLPNSAVPDSVANAIHYAADHIPVFAKFAFPQLLPFDLTTPSNGATSESVSGMLTWQPSTGASGYDVYLGTTNPPTNLVSTNQTGTSYSYSGLTNNLTYYWKVVSKNTNSTRDATGSPWNFTTNSPIPPDDFSLVYPPNGATDNSSAGTLIWNASQYATSYDVYLDTIISTPSRVSLNQTDTSYSYAHLLTSTTYYWKVVAKNVADSTVAAGSPHNFTVGNVPIAPTNLQVTYISDKSIHLVWTDNASNETGYHIYKSTSALGKVNFNLPPNSTSYIDTLLLPNTNYFYEVAPFNEFGDGMFDSASALTNASIPDVKDYFDYGMTSIFVAIDPKSNPVVTEYSINVTDDTLAEKYVQADGTLGIIPVWQIFSSWGGNSGVQVKNLNPNTTYYISVKARNLENISTDPSSVKNITTNNFSISYLINQGWNLISVPVDRTDKRKIVVFPFASSSAFLYQNGYAAKDTLSNGKGYWLKFNSAIPTEVGGSEKYQDTIELVTGWNLIGSISREVAAANIAQIPPGIIVSSYWAYKNGYSPADTIKPMLAYWVKAYVGGSIVLDSVNRFGKFSNADNENFDNFNKLIFKDRSGNAQKIYFSSIEINSPQRYEMPPVPPGQCFDVRFKSNRFIESFKGKSSQQILANFNSCPIDVEWEIKDGATYSISIPGFENSIIIKDKGNVSIGRSEIKSIDLKLVNGDQWGAKENVSPVDFHLYRNYPNPFNPSTNISYYFPTASHVRLVISNIIGEEIEVLSNTIIEAGSHSTTWNAKVPSGVYFIKLEAIPLNQPTKIFRKVERMILMK